MGRIDHEQVVEIVGQAVAAAQEVDRLAHRPEAGNRDHVALHQTPGARFRIRQALFQDRAEGGGHRLHDRDPAVVVQRLDQVQRVVAFQLGYGRRQIGGAELLDHVQPHAVVQFGQDGRVEAVADRPDQLRALPAVERFQQIGQIGIAQRRHQRPHALGLVQVEGVAHLVHEFGRQSGDPGVGPAAFSLTSIGRPAQWPKPMDDAGQFGHAVDPLVSLLRRLDMFVRPGDVVGHMDRASADLQHRQDVGPDGVADHQEPLRRDPMPGQHPPVGGGVLFRHDLDRVEHLGKAGARDLAFLVEQVALGDQHQPMAVAEVFDRFGDAVQKLDRVPQHRLAGLDHRLDVAGLDPPVGDLDRRLDHRQDEALDAVAEQAEVAPLGVEQPAVDIGRQRLAQHGAELLLRHGEDRTRCATAYRRRRNRWSKLFDLPSLVMSSRFRFAGCRRSRTGRPAPPAGCRAPG